MPICLDTDLAPCTVDLPKAVTAKSTATLSTWVLLIDTAACVRRKRVHRWGPPRDPGAVLGRHEERVAPIASDARTAPASLYLAGAGRRLSR
jgi:hypothetical protein